MGFEDFEAAKERGKGLHLLWEIGKCEGVCESEEKSSFDPSSRSSLETPRMSVSAREEGKRQSKTVSLPLSTDFLP
jgi:hypothetical protein